MYTSNTKIVHNIVIAYSTLIHEYYDIIIYGYSKNKWVNQTGEIYILHNNNNICATIL